MNTLFMNAGTLCTITVAGAVATLFLVPPHLALLVMGALLILAAVFFLFRGDIVFSDPELSRRFKTSFCVFLCGSGLVVLNLGRHHHPGIPLPLKSEVAQDQGNRLPGASLIGSAQAAPYESAVPSAPPAMVNSLPADTKPLVESGETNALIRPVVAPRESIAVTGLVFGRSEGTDKPLASASIRAGQYEAMTDSAGRFTLRFSSKQRDELLVKISHADHLPKFRRLDEVCRENTTVLQPKLRVAVLDFSVPDGSNLAPQEKALRKSIERELVNTTHIKVALNDDERGKVLRVLHKQQQERGIYDKDTLNQMGRMCAASHGIFGSIDSDGSNYKITCTLANFSAGTTEKEQVIRVQGKAGWSDFAGSILGFQTLAQLSDVRILTPGENSTNERLIKAEGFAVLRPPEWSLWLTLVPNGSSLHYPQQRLTVEADESWKSSQVHLGTESPTLNPLTFTLYALLADPEHSHTISNYLSSKSNVGLDINAWDKSHYRIGHSIELSRHDSHQSIKP